MREKVGKSRTTVFFQWFVAEGRKVGSLKRRVRSQLARWEMKNCTPLVARSTLASQNVQHTWVLGPLLEVEMSKKCTPLWREAHLQVKMYKTPGARTTFGSWDVEKVHAVVARSTFPSQNVQNTSASDHFWKLRCRKSARRCGAKHISKRKCTKHTMYGPFLDVQMSFRVAGARDSAPCQKWPKREGFVAFSTTTTTTLHHTTLQYITLQLQLQLQLQLHLHYILPHYTPLHYTALNYTQLHYTTLHYIKLGTRLTGGREEISTPSILAFCFSADLQWSEHPSPF